MRRWLLNVFLILALIVLVYFAWLSIQWKFFLDSPMLAENAQPMEFEIRSGTSVVNVAWQLKRQGLIQRPEFFIWLALLRDNLNDVKAGEYLIEPGKTTPSQFLNNIVAGKVILRQLTVIEGWTFRQLMDAVNTNPYLTHTLTNLNNNAVMDKLGYPGVNPEGRFYPDTYLFGKGTTDVKILKKSYRDMQTVLTNAWNNRAPNLPYKDAYEALIAASLIERETSVAQERPQIAGVIVRRLQKNMRLQIDATVIYALGDKYRGKLTSQDMSFTSPYNTYLRSGLTPSPIAMPSAASINAALHPAAGDALYYVASGTGGHVFSPTLSAHDTAIEKYLLAPKICVSLPYILKINSTSICPIGSNI